MERIAALVEGHTEAHFIKLSYGNSIVQRPFPNGRDVSIDIIVESIVDAMETIGGNINHIIILLDREGRAVSWREIFSHVLEKSTEIFAGRNIYMGLTDRHIENWILADESFIADKFAIESYSYAGDGTYGKSILESICGNTLRGPVDKAMMLKAISSIRGGEKSPSLEAFRSSIAFDWAWANK